MWRSLLLLLGLSLALEDEAASDGTAPQKMLAISTWSFGSATAKAWDTLEAGMSAIDAVEKGCTVCEEQQCDGTVGFGGSPGENGETALDAMIMDGRTCNVGAVGSLRRIKPAISVARKVLENTRHSLLVGDLATEFAVEMGFTEETLQTDVSKEKWTKWKENNCQPNFWTNVQPDPSKTCGPYKPSTLKDFEGQNSINFINKNSMKFGGEGNHDTIGMVAIDSQGNVASGTSTNGASFKISGRVGDSPIPGAGSYADNQVGGAAATGDGDVMLRFLPSFLAVESMRNGLPPAFAAKVAMERIVERHPEFMGAVIAVNLQGQVGASCHGLDSFPFTVASSETDGVVVQMNVDCI